MTTIATFLFCCCLESCTASSDISVVRAQATNNGETIVLIRHGEIPAASLGQLNCMGLNRSLALPKVFRERFATPAAIFAPDPADTIKANGHVYSYVRPLATIEPTAIALGLPVNTQMGYMDISDLQTAVTAPAYANSTVLIAWEHAAANQFAQNLLKAYGQDPSQVPPWPSNDFERMYVFHISPPTAGSAALGTLTFQVQQEGLEDSLSEACPGQF